MESATLNNVLETYPDLVATALEQWKRAEIETERLEASVYFQLKGQAELEGEKVTEKWLERKIALNEEVYAAKMVELMAEANYQRLYETLMSCKKLAQIRAAY